jgi:hypothetical protein
VNRSEVANLGRGNGVQAVLEILFQLLRLDS